jgi:hypothetical protein
MSAFRQNSQNEQNFWPQKAAKIGKTGISREEREGREGWVALLQRFNVSLCDIVCPGFGIKWG